MWHALNLFFRAWNLYGRALKQVDASAAFWNVDVVKQLSS